MGIYLILHNIRSLHNVGSIFRTADAAGVKKIYLTGYTPSPYAFFGPPAGGLRKEFAKTALGAEKFVMWEQRKNISALIKELKRTSPPRDAHLSSWDEVFIISLEQSQRAVPYNKLAAIYRSKFKKHNRNSFPRYTAMALIVGNEVRGISPAILKKSDAIIEIPMRGRKESLNVAVAAGIALYSLREQFGGTHEERVGVL